MFVDILILMMAGITLILTVIAVAVWVHWKIGDWMISTVGNERSERCG